MKAMRQPTLETLGLGSVLGIFKGGRLPADEKSLVERVFGPKRDRGCLVISGGNGIVGSGKAMQLGARLEPYGVPIVTLDLPDAPDGLGKQYPGLMRAFGAKQAAGIMSNVIRFNYDGGTLPKELKKFKPRFVLEAIPEILPLKRAHYDLMRKTFPGIEIRSVTSGFPSKELGVGILHPSFPHQINKVWEVVESKPSDITKLFWSLGLIPVPVGDYWSFILDVLFCDITLAALRYHRATNMPFWKLDKFVRRSVGPNPVRAHDAIGPGASFLTWSCLHHLAEKYGELFRPPPELVRRKNSGEAWYSSNRPTVDWTMDDEELFQTWLMGPLFQMTSLMLHENRAPLAHMNAIGELCAQFSRGIIAQTREYGSDAVVKRVHAYHMLHPGAAKDSWYPKAFKDMFTPDWQQLYVNAEHDGKVGVITISRETLNWDVISELNRAIEWLLKERVRRVIVTGDFHLSTQMVGADISEFFPALQDAKAGLKVAKAWSMAARRLYDDFEVSVGFVGGKRCLGGMLELMMHCHYLVAVDEAQLGMPEVTLPVVPGMEGCHWAFRKTATKDFPKLFNLLLTGKPVFAKESVGWLADYAGSMEDALKKAWQVASGGKHGLRLRKVAEGALKLPAGTPALPQSSNPLTEAARKAIVDTIKASCGTTLAQALEVQARHSAGFMVSKECNKGVVGTTAAKTLKV